MKRTETRLATIDDAEMIVAMLSKLAGEISGPDHCNSTRQAIEKYGFGKNPLFQCLVATSETTALGMALFFPTFSSDRGKPGVYVQDLWVSHGARGQGLGQQLLSDVISHARGQWDAAYLMLVVHANNENAREFYQRLGFTSDQNDMPLALDGDAFARIGGDA
ncbi:MAG TPA: GNAT family N-acetyltransferase [Rhizobiales bacterium]|nr:GNAT family N-acetyltransferase [Hyphomicrobiales bacterium]